jgi:hypothetical protein
MSSSAGRAKRDREKAKREKAALKRDKRLNGGSGEEPDDVESSSLPRRSQDEVLAELQQLHQRFEAEAVSFDDFEVLKAQLMSQLDVG